ncbi:MAG: hypothetical protein Q4P32_00905 [Micrococcales bacterium]|nr:hypothetical protein [Micrococcales bacterium]
MEATLRDGPGIDDALVVGLPDPVHGARLVALWIHSGPSDGPAPAFGEVPAGLSALVAPLPTYARPRSWVRMPAVPGLPRTSAGKPDRPVARALAADTGVQGP